MLQIFQGQCLRIFCGVTLMDKSKGGDNRMELEVGGSISAWEVKTWTWCHPDLRMR